MELWNEITEKRFRDWNAAADRRKWKSAEEMYTSFKETFDECRDVAEPKQTFKYNDRRTYPPWWNDNMREAKKKLNMTKRNFKRHSTQLKKTEEEYKRGGDREEFLD